MANLEVSSVAQPICVWTDASRKFAIHLHPHVIGCLGIESRVAFKRVPRRGLEIGGILIGRTDFREDTTTFWIEGFQPVESEHRSGPSYVLSESDLANLQAALAKNGAASIGIYRSQTRSDRLVLQARDIELYEKCFDTGDALFLMLGPVPGIAAFFIRADGNLKCIHEFALASSLSSIMTLRQGGTAPPLNLHPQPTAEIQGTPSRVVRRLDPPEKEDTLSVVAQRLDHQPVPAPVLKRSGLKMKLGSGLKIGTWILAAAITSLVVAAAVSVLSNSVRRSSAPDRQAPEYLHLAVERAGPALRLLWDRNSAAVSGATGAVLHIQDGDQRSDRDLAPSQLSAGSTTYEPKNAEVTFQLEVYSAEPNAIGSIQVMNLAPNSTLAPVPPGQPNVQPASNRPASTPLPVKALTTRTERPPADLIGKENKKADVQSPAPKSSGGTATNSLSTRGASAPTALEKAPQRPSTPTAFDKAPQRSPLAEAAVPISDREPSIQILAEPVSGSRLGQLVGKVPLLRRLRKPVKTATPVPLYQAQPSLKVSDKQSLVRPVSVDVKVYVGESGTVNSAEVVDYGDPPNWGLANAALAAARDWTFEPARIEDAAVSSEVILHFRFNP